MPKTNELARFRLADDTLKERIIAASFGEVGTLKTSFWLSAPGPIVVQSCDRGLEGVVEEFRKKKDIYVVEYDANTSGIEQDEAIETRDKLTEDFEHAVKHARTVIWDKETQVYEIFKYAEFGAPSDAPSNYYPLFQRYRRVINLAKSADVNFGIIQGMKNPWAPKVNKKTGAQGAMKTEERVRRGMPEIEEIVHINIEHVFEEGKFQLKIGKSRGPGGREIQNTTIPFMQFAEFATLVFPNTDVEDWA